ncbi:MAG: cation transporter [Trueperaceae bacterium]|nr:cation transporter [Trueperaceae bacterium]
MNEFTIQGMTCGHCKKAVEEALGSVDGVTRVDVDLDAGHARVEGGDVERLVAAVAEEGYTATPAS